MVWYGVVWCSMVQYGAVWCSMVQYGAVWCGMEPPNRHSKLPIHPTGIE